MGRSISSAYFENIIWSIFFHSKDSEEFLSFSQTMEEARELEYDKLYHKGNDCITSFDLNGWTFKPLCSFSDVVKDKLYGSDFCAVKENFGVDFINTHEWASGGGVDIAAVGSIDSLKEFLKDFKNFYMNEEIDHNQIVAKNI